MSREEIWGVPPPPFLRGPWGPWETCRDASCPLLPLLGQGAPENAARGHWLLPSERTQGEKTNTFKNLKSKTHGAERCQQSHRKLRGRSLLKGHVLAGLGLEGGTVCSGEQEEASGRIRGGREGGYRGAGSGRLSAATRLQQDARGAGEWRVWKNFPADPRGGCTQPTAAQGSGALPTSDPGTWAQPSQGCPKEVTVNKRDREGEA